MQVCLTVDSGEVCLVGLEAVLRNGEYCGHIRRGDHAFYLDKEVGYGYVSKPDGGKITNAWLLDGEYQVKHLKSIFQYFQII